MMNPDEHGNVGESPSALKAMTYCDPSTHNVTYVCCPPPCKRIRLLQLHAAAPRTRIRHQVAAAKL
jgi:hypothetical protein